MPIKPENKKLYPRYWKELSLYIREIRAENKCEFCGVQNKTEYIVFPDGSRSPRALFGIPASENKFASFLYNHAEKYGNVVRIILTVAHLDHDPTNCDPNNLKALCQRCHLRYDKDHHTKNSKITFYNKKYSGNLELFESERLEVPR